ncbi:MAG: hypothetical protein Q4P31_03875 [Andreesenia angusta]|nr:hypothetical protein [Andreesenia angusta]
MPKFIVIISLVSILFFTMENININIEKILIRNLIINDIIKKHNDFEEIKMEIEKEILKIFKDYRDSEYMIKDQLKYNMNKIRINYNNKYIDIMDYEDKYINNEELDYYLINIYDEKDNIVNKLLLRLDLSKEIEDKEFISYIELKMIGDLKDGFGQIELIISIFLISILSIGIFNFANSIVRFSNDNMKYIYREDEINRLHYFLEENIESMNKIEYLNTNYYYGEDLKESLKRFERVKLRNIAFSNTYINEDYRDKNLFILEVKKKNIEGEILNKINFSRQLKDKTSSNAETISNIIDSISIEPIPESSNYEECKGIRFIFNIGKNEIKKSYIFKNEWLDE